MKLIHIWIKFGCLNVTLVCSLYCAFESTMSSKVSIYATKDWNMNWVIILFSPQNSSLFTDVILSGTHFTIADTMQITQEGDGYYNVLNNSHVCRSHFQNFILHPPFWLIMFCLKFIYNRWYKAKDYTNPFSTGRIQIKVLTTFFDFFL